MRIIDADKLRAEYQAILDRGDMFCEYDIIGMLDKAPTVCNDNYSMGYQDGVKKVLSERPTGEWQLHGMIYYCSECGHDCGESGDNFCGNCGADMRVKDELNNELNELKEAENE